MGGCTERPQKTTGCEGGETTKDYRLQAPRGGEQKTKRLLGPAQVQVETFHRVELLAVLDATHVQ